jgi:hydrogenase assembly chaperone HypC/HupF
MCLDFPGLVTALHGDLATVLTDGRARTATTLLVPDVRVGEWVVVMAGSIVDRLSAESAAQISQLLGVVKGNEQ